MKRRRLLMGAAALPAWGTPLAQAADGAAPGARIVSVAGALTEVVYALGAQSHLVGTDTTSLWPEAARNTPKVGYMRQLSAEGLLSLRPTHVLGTDEAGPGVVFEQIRAAGVRVELVQATHRFDEVISKVRLVGQITQRRAQAEQLAAQLQAQWSEQARQIAARRAARTLPQVLFVLAHGGAPQVSGRNTAAAAVIDFAGGVNAVTDYAGYRPLTAESLAAAAPQIVLTTTQALEASGGEAAFWSHPGWALTPAGRNRRLVALDALYLLGFGPRLPQAVAELAAKWA